MPCCGIWTIHIRLHEGEVLRKNLPDFAGNGGCQVKNRSLGTAGRQDVVLVDGDRLKPDKDLITGLGRKALNGGKIILHACSVEQLNGFLSALGLAGQAAEWSETKIDYDTFCHDHELCNGITNNYLYWIVDKDKLAPWCRANLHPRPATAVIQARNGKNCKNLTKNGSVTVYHLGKGIILFDNLNWQDTALDEPERVRRYVSRLLTNLGVPLTKGAGKKDSIDYETDAEKRERGHF